MKNLDPRFIWLLFLNNVAGWMFSWTVFFIGLFSVFALSSIESGRPFSFSAAFGITLFVYLTVACLALVAGYIWARLTYYFYRYELREDGFRKEHGVIWKKYVTIPYDRIQNVDIYRGVLARILGLSDLQVQTAGGTSRGSYGMSSEGRLPGLSKELAEELRDELIGRTRSSKSQGGL